MKRWRRKRKRKKLHTKKTKKMISKSASGVAIASLGCIIILYWMWKLLKGLWLTPKKLEKCLKQQGLVGNSYKFLIGDMKESSKLRNEALQKPIPFTHDYYNRIQPFIHQILNNSGKCLIIVFSYTFKYKTNINYSTKKSFWLLNRSNTINIICM